MLFKLLVCKILSPTTESNRGNPISQSPRKPCNRPPPGRGVKRRLLRRTPIWRQISVKTPRTTRSHLVVVHLVWFPNTIRIAVGFPNLMHDHEVRPRLTRYDLISRGTTSSHKVRPRLTRLCIVLGNQTLTHFIGISNGMLLGKCVHTNCYSTLHHSMRSG